MTDQEGHKIEGHNYDGIQELDNSLPRWWINLFYFTIVFAVGYFMYYVVGEGPSLVREYERDKQAAEYSLYLHRGPVKTISEEELRAVLKDPARAHAGEVIFQAKCLSCHGAGGGGGIGPNLTDEYWLHGGGPIEVLATITDGVGEKGMPPWGPLLKPEESQSLVAYIHSIHGSHPPGAKAPQGEKVKAKQ